MLPGMAKPMRARLEQAPIKQTRPELRYLDGFRRTRQTKDHPLGEVVHLVSVIPCSGDTVIESTMLQMESTMEAKGEKYRLQKRSLPEFRIDQASSAPSQGCSYPLA